MRMSGAAILAVPLLLAAADNSDEHVDRPIDCRSCAAWNEPQAPHPFLFRMHERLEQGGDASIGGGECAACAENALVSLERRLSQESERGQRR